MAYALVGSAGAVSVGAAGAAVTPAYGQSPTAGNLLILAVACSVSASGTGSAPTAPTGWSLAVQQQKNGTGQIVSASIFYKIAAGGDSAPTVAAVGNQVLSAQLFEFSGNTSTPLDQTGSNISVGTERITVTASGLDAEPGELVFAVTGVTFNGVSNTDSAVDSLNNGATTTTSSNSGTNTPNHFTFSYGVTTGNAADDANTRSGGYTSGTIVAGVIASFKVADTGPTNTVAPAVTGTAQVGDTLSSTTGTWTGGFTPYSYSYQWQRDDHGGGTYSNIPGATSSSYTLVDADDGCEIRCVVTNTDGGSVQVSANSNSVGTVVEPAPVNTVAPVISGVTQALATLSATTGTWSNMGGYNPSYSYQWQSSPDGSAWSDIPGATSSTYTLADGDIGDDIRCVVSAHNTGSP